MATADIRWTIDRLTERLHRVDCLAQPTITNLESWLRATGRFATEEQLAAFGSHVDFVEKVSKEVGHPSFRSLCSRIHTEPSPRRLLRRLGVECRWPWSRPPKWPWDWYLFADSVGVSQPAAGLFCSLNGWICPQHASWDQMHAGVGLIAFALSRLGNYRVAAAVLAWFFQLPEFNFKLHEVKGRLDEHLVFDEVRRITRLDWFLSCLRAWIHALHGCNRVTDAACIVDAWLQGDPDSYDSETLQSSVRTRLGGAAPEVQARFVIEAAEVLMSARRPGDAVFLFQAWNEAGGREKYGSGAYFRKCLPATGVRIVSTTAAALRAFGMPQRAADKIDFWLCVKSVDDITRPHVVSAPSIRSDQPQAADGQPVNGREGAGKEDPTLDERVQRLNKIIREIGKSHGFRVARELAESLTAAGKPHEANLLLLSLVDVKYMEFAPLNQHHLRATLRRELHDLSLNERLLFIETLVRILDSPELAKHRATLARPIISLTTVVCDDFGWLSDSDESVDTGTAVGLMLLWLDVCAEYEQVVSTNLLDRFVKWLRNARDPESLSPTDRLLLARKTSDLRWKIIQAAREAAGGVSNPVSASAVYRQTLLWEQELGQRSALERLLTTIPSRLRTDGAEEPINRIPFRDIDIADYLSRGLFDQASATTKRPLAVLREEVGHSSSSQPMMLSDFAKRDPPPWLHRAEDLVTKGIDERTLAALLGDGGVLLQLGFSRKGSTVWTATESDGRSLKLVAQDQGESSKEARQRLRWAVARHDLMVALATMDSDRKERWAKFAQDEGIVLQSYVANLASSDEEKRFAVMQRDFPSELRRFQQKLSLPSIDALLMPLLAPPREWNEFDQWADTTPRELRAVLELIQNPARLSSVPCASLLSDATEQLLAEVVGHCCLDELQQYLRTDHTNLVVQASDAWHGIPVAYLPVGENRLFQNVRSIRSSFSTLLDQLSLQIEDSLNDEQRSSQHLLCVSWFDADDPCWLQAFELHRAHQERGPACYAAAQDPPGRVTTLLRGIQARPYRIVTVLGHGTDKGVKLAPESEGKPGYWRGEGVDLTAVELLLLVSCSFGRVRETGERDVDGFCVEQAIHRGRAAIACRWPVLADEAVQFASRLVQRYVELRSTQSDQISSLRALAVNDTRKYFFDATRAHGGVGLNTAAAFELYGLG